MANTDAPFGLRPIHADGRPYTGALNEYYVPATDSTALFIGDPVKLAGAADTDGVPTVTAAAAGDPILGVYLGKARPLRDATKHRAASTAEYVLVADDPDLAFEVQEDSDGGALAAADVGLNANLLAGSGSTATGVSGFTLDSSSADTTATLDFQIVRLSTRGNNAIGDYAVWVVRPNTHHRAHGTTGL